jgi:pyruvate carboxylase
MLPEELAVVRERLKALQVTAAPLVRADQREYLCGLRDGVEHAVDLNPGVRLLMGINTVSEPDERGM